MFYKESSDNSEFKTVTNYFNLILFFFRINNNYFKIIKNMKMKTR